MKHTKITIVGAGSVGSTTAYALLLQGIASEIELIDINEQKCEGEVYDLSDARSFSRCTQVKRACSDETKKPDIVIISAGLAQKSGQSRDELAQKNKKIVTSVVEQLKPFEKHTVIIVVTNPVDTMAFYAHQASGLPHNQVFGSGTLLDSVRLRGFLSKKVSVAPESIQAYVLGEHGETQFPVWSSATIAGKPLSTFGIAEKELEEIAYETEKRAYRIIDCKGATFFGIAACVAQMCESILFNQKKVMPVSSYNKEYDLFISLPAVLGCKGVENVIVPSMNEKERTLLDFSSERIRSTIEKI